MADEELVYIIFDDKYDYLLEWIRDDNTRSLVPLSECKSLKCLGIKIVRRLKEKK